MVRFGLCGPPLPLKIYPCAHVLLSVFCSSVLHFSAYLSIHHFLSFSLFSSVYIFPQSLNDVSVPSFYPHTPVYLSIYVAKRALQITMSVTVYVCPMTSMSVVPRRTISECGMCSWISKGKYSTDTSQDDLNMPWDNQTTCKHRYISL